MNRIVVTGGKANKIIPLNKDGTFIRIHKHWSLENFDDGWVDNRGRFRVYFPEHPRAFNEGYILRSIVAYEAYHPNDIVTKEYAIHHKNKNRLDDSELNLEKKLFWEHSRDHRTLPKIKLICNHCGKEFERSKWRVSQYRNAGYTLFYCSSDCYKNRGVS